MSKDKDKKKYGQKKGKKMNENYALVPPQPTQPTSSQVEPPALQDATTSQEAAALTNLSSTAEQPNISLTQEEIIMMKKLLQSLCGFCANQATGTGEPTIVYKDRIVEKEVIKEVEIIKTPAPPSHIMFEVLAIVQSDHELKRLWLGDTNDELEALFKITATMSQWERIESLWDTLAIRCREQRRAVNDDEQILITQAIHTYNLTRSTYKASLVTIEAGTRYDYEQHQQGNTTGDRVKSTWLAGLRNAGGELVRKPLVETL